MIINAFDMKKARDGNRTRLPSLGSWCSTDELHVPDKIKYSTSEKEFKYFLSQILQNKMKSPVLQPGNVHFESLVAAKVIA